MPQGPNTCCTCGTSLVPAETPTLARGLHVNVTQALPYSVRIMGRAFPLLEVEFGADGKQHLLKGGYSFRTAAALPASTERATAVVNLIPSPDDSEEAWSLYVTLQGREVFVVPNLNLPEPLEPTARVEVFPPPRRESDLGLREGRCENPRFFTRPSIYGGGLPAQQYHTWRMPPGVPRAIGWPALVRLPASPANRPDEWGVFLHAYTETQRPQALAWVKGTLSDGGEIWHWVGPKANAPAAYCKDGQLLEPSVVARDDGRYDMAVGYGEQGKPERIVLIEDVMEGDKSTGTDCGKPLLPAAGASPADLGCTAVKSPSLASSPGGGHVLFFLCERQGQPTVLRALGLHRDYTPAQAPVAVGPIGTPGQSGEASLAVVEVVPDGDRFVILYVPDGNGRQHIYRAEARPVSNSQGQNPWPAPDRWDVKLWKLPVFDVAHVAAEFPDSRIDHVAAAPLGTDSRRLLLLLSLGGNDDRLDMFPIIKESW